MPACLAPVQAEQAAAARSVELASVRRTLEDALSVARREAETSRQEVIKVCASVCKRACAHIYACVSCIWVYVC